MSWPLRLALGLVRSYQRLLSPLMPMACRFSPSCSMYCYEALQRYGLVRGALMTLKRLSRCHPLHPGGFDPVR